MADNVNIYNLLNSLSRHDDPYGAIKALVDATQDSANKLRNQILGLLELPDVDAVPDVYLPNLAELIGVRLRAQDPARLRRQQVKNAIWWYKTKGTSYGYKTHLRTQGFDTTVYELFEIIPDGPWYLTRVPGSVMSSRIGVELDEIVEGTLAQYLTTDYINVLLGDIADITPAHIEISFIVIAKTMTDQFTLLNDELTWAIDFFDTFPNWLCCHFYGLKNPGSGFRCLWDSGLVPWDGWFWDAEYPSWSGDGMIYYDGVSGALYDCCRWESDPLTWVMRSDGWKEEFWWGPARYNGEDGTYANYEGRLYDVRPRWMDGLEIGVIYGMVETQTIYT